MTDNSILDQPRGVQKTLQQSALLQNTLYTSVYVFPCTHICCLKRYKMNCPQLSPSCPLWMCLHVFECLCTCSDYVPIAEGGHSSHVDSLCVCFYGCVLLVQQVLIQHIGSHLWHQCRGEYDGRKETGRGGRAVVIGSPHLLVRLAGGITATSDGILLAQISKSRL